MSTLRIPRDKARPLIGIAPDVVEPRPASVRAMCALTYARAIAAAGGEPVILPPLIEAIPRQLEACAGFVLTGGDDPRTELFGVPTHPKATPVHPVRQEYDTALLHALLDRADIPTLGVCLGMQMMALVCGGRLDQHLPETLATHERHWNNAVHTVHLSGLGTELGVLEGEVASHHRQAVSDPGRLSVLATSEDGVIEAVGCAGSRFFVGVQWHPERTQDTALGRGVFERLVLAAAERAAHQRPG